MRFLALLVGLIAAFGGSYGAFAAMQAVGPENRTGEFGFGDAATASPGGGDLFESRNFALVVAALERELGADGRISYLRVERTEASATARVGDIQRTIADRRFRALALAAAATRRGSPPGCRCRGSTRTRSTSSCARPRSRRARRSRRLDLQSNTREWNVDMDGGEPDAFIANLDGGGLRLSGEPNPVRDRRDDGLAAARGEPRPR